MIVRLVKLTFRPDQVAGFQQLFDGWRHRIIAFPGCRQLQLLHDVSDPSVFFTYSVWDSPAHLQAYRRSEVFVSVWPVVKERFAQPAQAWTVEQEHAMGASA